MVYAGVHRDESTPHMYAYVVPLDESTGRLNARRWLGFQGPERDADGLCRHRGRSMAWSAVSRAAGPSMSG